ncbi:hypothetical protein IT570_14135 [Candidatus Sumerlaeota bacterium]|nr:hypothetical protein [Candidatus Sumerlaeota bacterium]
MALSKQNPAHPDYKPKWVRDHLAASERVMKKALKSKASARKLLQEAGILDKKGNLAKPYRP